MGNSCSNNCAGDPEDRGRIQDVVSYFHQHNVYSFTRSEISRKIFSAPSLNIVSKTKCYM